MSMYERLVMRGGKWRGEGKDDVMMTWGVVRLYGGIQDLWPV
jgi:hypothetical protein